MAKKKAAAGGGSAAVKARQAKKLVLKAKGKKKGRKNKNAEAPAGDVLGQESQAVHLTMLEQKIELQEHEKQEMQASVTALQRERAQLKHTACSLEDHLRREVHPLPLSSHAHQEPCSSLPPFIIAGGC